MRYVEILGIPYGYRYDNMEHTDVPRNYTVDFSVFSVTRSLIRIFSKKAF